LTVGTSWPQVSWRGKSLGYRDDLNVGEVESKAVSSVRTPPALVFAAALRRPATLRRMVVFVFNLFDAL